MNSAISNIKNFIDNHVDFDIDIIFLLLSVILVLILPCSLFLPENYGYENGIIENIQMIVLFLSCFFCLKAKRHKTFFRFCFLMLTILLLREVNCGRTLFFAVPGAQNAFYSWKEIKYGWLAHPIYGVYIGCVVLYGLWNKVWLDVLDFLKKGKIPFWNCMFFVLGIALSLIAEKCTNNFVFEECSELLMYVALFGILHTYSRKMEK